jgi:hypothetical protein
MRTQGTFYLSYQKTKIRLDLDALEAGKPVCTLRATKRNLTAESPTLMPSSTPRPQKAGYAVNQRVVGSSPGCGANLFKVSPGSLWGKTAFKARTRRSRFWCAIIILHRLARHVIAQAPTVAHLQTKHPNINVMSNKARPQKLTGMAPGV